MVPLLFGIVTVTFFVTHILPGDPAVQLAGPDPTLEQIQQTRHEYGFDQPVYEQYWHYIKGIFLHLNLGNSIFTGHPVLSDLVDRMPSTLELAGVSLFIALLIGIPVGALAAIRAGGRSDMGVRVYSYMFLSIPEFWFALLALYIFFFRLGWAPAPFGQLGITDPHPQHITGAALIDSTLTLNWGAFKASLANGAIAFLTFGIIISASIIRLMRSSMLEVLSADYIRFARTCGLSTITIWRYTVRNALPPVITLAGIVFVHILGGAVIIEKIFSWNGAAYYAGDAIAQSDYNPIAGFVLAVGVVSIIVFLITDLLHAAIDPRVKL
jgi:peptide/nickel transport system permease protein